jgi:hypothetical protein
VSFTSERARVASLTRSRTPDDPELVDARRNMRAERLADHIRRTVDAAPPLTAEQRDRLALLLRGGAPPGGGPTQALAGGADSTEPPAQRDPHLSGDAA